MGLVRHLVVAMVGLGIAGCERSGSTRAQPQPISEPAIERAVGSPLRIAAGDLDGDRRPELVMADARELWVADLSGRELARRPVPGGIQVLRIADIDADGRGELLTGWGETREHREAEASIAIYRLVSNTLVEESVARPPTSRNQVVDVLPIPGSPNQLLACHFESKYMVRIAKARRSNGGRWELLPLDTIRMATSCATGDVDGDGTVDIIVGRLYGDDMDADGDAFVLRPDGSRAPIPTKGGVQAIEVVDLDGDERLEILLADGWNKNYGQLARARLTRSWWSGDQFRSELIEESAGQYTLLSVFAADVNGDGRQQIVTRGNAHLRVSSRSNDHWSGKTVASKCDDVAPLALEAAGGTNAMLTVCEGAAKVLRP